MWAVLSSCIEFVTKYCVDLRCCSANVAVANVAGTSVVGTNSAPRRAFCDSVPPTVPPSQTTGSGGVDDRGLQVLVNSTLRDPEGATHPDSRKLTTVNQAIHRHLRHTHEGCDLGDGGEPYVGQSAFLGHRAPHVLRNRRRTGFPSGMAPLCAESRIRADADPRR